MKKLLLFLLVTVALCHCGTAKVHASWVPPQPPFSAEGNPTEDYFYGSIFDLLKYIRPAAFEVYENKDRNRNYADLEVCGGHGGRDNPYDSRDYYCNTDGDGCDGGSVDLCHRGTTDVAQTAYSKPNNSCTAHLNDNHPDYAEGTCKYNQTPREHDDFKGTDFSDASQTVFKKIQDKSGAYNNVGSDDNPITYGSQQLALTFNDKIIKQLLVVRRAKQTKNTVHDTGEWPLGWVDWGYKTQNGKTLLEINEELPDSIASVANSIVEGTDDFYLNGGNLEAVSDISSDVAQVTKVTSEALSQNPPPVWLTDLMQAPLYSPSWRQSYVRPSICVWNICCPGLRCIVPQPIGEKRGLYYDNSISQAFGAALDTMLTAVPLDEGIAEFKKLVVTNPLVRFATSAAPNAVPSKIKERLDKEIGTQDPCYKYRSGFDWLWFGTFMDYVNVGDFFDAEKKCPVYAIAPELSKQNADAFYESPLSAFIAMVWGRIAPPQDEVDEVYHHVLTIPEAMGQAIQEIQQPVYDERDPLSELNKVKDFNINLSNTVEDNSDGLYGGETPFDPRRRLGYYACDDSMFSSQLDTSIQAYAMGTRIGCNQQSNATTAGKCDGTKFAAIIKDSPWKAPLPDATSVVLNSAMFVGGKLNPKLEEAYAKTSGATGVPCEVLAGIHFEEASSCFTEGSSPETCSNANGGPVGEQGGFQKTVDTAAKAILRHPINSTQNLITAMSDFNGGGNSNCQTLPGTNIPYGGCPRQFIGEDDPYATHMLDSRHANMYQIYCGDFKVCSPLPAYDKERPGAFAVALAVYNEATNKNSPTDSSSTTASPTTSTFTPPSTGTSVNPAGTCGNGYIDTALGCLPYERTAFIMALLRFLVGISGAIALIVMLTATIQIMTSSGDTKKVQAGRELFTSAIAGLLFLILSAAILRIFGFDILKLPGF